MGRQLRGGDEKVLLRNDRRKTPPTVAYEVGENVFLRRVVFSQTQLPGGVSCGQEELDGWSQCNVQESNVAKAETLPRLQQM